MPDGYFLFLKRFPSNYDFFYITFSPVAMLPRTFSHISLPCNRRFNLRFGFTSAIKKARQEVV